MKIISGWRSSNYLAIFSVFLVAVVLVVGIVGCVPTQYELTISSGEGGEVTTPGEGAFSYEEGTVVDLTAEAEEGYWFVNWTGDVDAIANIASATTNITMNSNYIITANFAPEMPKNLEIRDWYDLDAIRDNLGNNHTLMNDLNSTTLGYEDLASETANEGKGWEPIGTFDNQFTGIFDGQGYEICDLFINRPDEHNVGLFGELGGVIRDIGVVNASLIGNWGVAGLVGENWGIMSHCYFTGNVTGVDDVGGLVGNNYDIVSNSYSTGSVTGSGGGVGGLVGSNEGSVRTSYSTGNVTGIRSVGGLVGADWYGGLTTSYSTGDVNGEDYVGGLIGGNIGGTVNNSFWDTETSDQATSDGGTGKNTNEMQETTTFSDAGWNIIAVVNTTMRNPSYIWNIVNNVTYPFLSWQPV